MNNNNRVFQTCKMLQHFLNYKLIFEILKFRKEWRDDMKKIKHKGGNSSKKLKRLRNTGWMNKCLHNSIWHTKNLSERILSILLQPQEYTSQFLFNHKNTPIHAVTAFNRGIHERRSGSMQFCLRFLL